MTHASRAALVIGWLLVTPVASAQDAGTPDCTSITPGSAEADACAEAAFRLATTSEHRENLSLVLAPRTIRPRPTPAYVRDSIQDVSTRAAHVASTYELVVAWRRAPWSVRALIAAGRMYERLASVFRMAAGRLDATMDAALRAIIRPHAERFECGAVVRYLLAVRAARAASIRLPEVSDALGMLGRYPVARVTECAVAHGRVDSSFTPFVPSDLDPLPP